MTPIHEIVPQRMVVYAAQEWWWCTGRLHRHREQRAAIRCEERRGVYEATQEGGQAEEAGE